MNAVFISTGKHDGAWNMAFDKLLMEYVSRGTFEIVIRTYGWNPACVSLGRLQKMSAEIDFAKLRTDGFDAVNRPTGGRAVWHENEVTYSVTAPVSDPFVSGNITEALRKVGKPVSEAMVSLGVDVQIKSTDSHRVGRKVPLNPCFTSISRYETGTIDGRKLIGSAQLRTKDVFLEHGSILIENDQPKLLDYLVEEKPSEWMEMMQTHLTTGIACLSEYIPDITVKDIETALYHSFSKVLNTKVEIIDFNTILCSRHLELMEEFRTDAE